MKVGNYEVKNVTRESAEVGCTKVTKAEVEAVLKAMNEKPLLRDFEIEKLPNYNEFLNFTIRNSSTGWIATSEVQEANDKGARYVNKSAFFCLEYRRAEKLLRFLAEGLGFTVSKPEAYIVEFSFENSPWSRSGNKTCSGTYPFDEAKRLAEKEQAMMGSGYRYRAVPKL